MAETSVVHKCFGNKAINKRKLSPISNQQLAVKVCNIFLKLSKITFKPPRFKLVCRGILWPCKPLKNSPVAHQIHPHLISYTKPTYREKWFKFLFTSFVFCTWLSLRNINIIITTTFSFLCNQFYPQVFMVWLNLTRQALQRISTSKPSSN